MKVIWLDDFREPAQFIYNGLGNCKKMMSLLQQFKKRISRLDLF